MAPTTPFNPSDLTQKARRDLLRLLEGVRGKKNLVIEKGLAGVVDLLVKYSTLQEYGVDQVFFLENANVDTSQRNVVFCVRGEKPKQVQAVAAQIKRVRQSSQIDHGFSIFWVPRRTLVSDQILEEDGVLGDVSISELPIYFIPLEKDLLSLQLEDSFGDLFLRKDPGSIFLTAKALMLIQQTHGLFPRIIGKGDNAKRLTDLLVRMRTEASVESSSSNTTNSPLSKRSTTIEDVIVIDRSIDLATPLLTQLTYEGLLDEVFTITNNHIDVPTSITGSNTTAPAQPPSSTSPATPAPPTTPLTRKTLLDASDPLFASLRDTNFALVGALLNKVARRLQATYDAHRAPQQTSSSTGGAQPPSQPQLSTAELRAFVARLPGYQAEQASLKTHTGLAEAVMAATRDAVWADALEVQQGVVAGATTTSSSSTSTVDASGGLEYFGAGGGGKVDELMARGAPLATVLRLGCLASVVGGGGMRAREAEAWKRGVVGAYGWAQLVTMAALERMGLFGVRAGGAFGFVGGGGEGGGQVAKSSDYGVLRRALRLVVDDVDEHAPQDIAYAYSGYAPLSIRVVQCVLLKRYLATLTKASAGVVQQAKVAEEGVGASLGVKAGFKPFEDALRYVKGPNVEIEQGNEGKDGKDREKARAILKGSGASGKEKDKDKVTLVVFVGGVCYAEVAACRFVAEQLEKEGRGRRIIVLTTSMISGDRMVGAAVQKQEVGNTSANSHS
ncbi:MAG: hypothetical protein M1821_008532 [Bathelium mastoideum]|nr:MAG: hypothetical protein M1821_008532 [Bathelium mastoideum]